MNVYGKFIIGLASMLAACAIQPLTCRDTGLSEQPVCYGTLDNIKLAKDNSLLELTGRLKHLNMRGSDSIVLSSSEAENVILCKNAIILSKDRSLIPEYMRKSARQQFLEIGAEKDVVIEVKKSACLGISPGEFRVVSIRPAQHLKKLKTDIVF